MSRCIGLLGGVAAGKSTVAGLLEARGWIRVDADRLAREAVEQPELLGKLTTRFGRRILDADGRLDRAELARRAFADEASTADLNALVHPEVRRLLAKEIAAAADRPVVLDVPLLLESPLADLVHTWVFVDSDPESREARARDRGWAPGERERREVRQAPLADKRARADHVLENSGTIEDLERQIEALLRSLDHDQPPGDR